MTADTAPAVDDLEDMVEAADSEAHEADSLVEALEERVLDGDAEVTADEFERAQGLAKFARKRAEGARRRKAAAEAARLEVETANIVQRFNSLASPRGHIYADYTADREAFEVAVQAAAAEWMQSALKHDRQVRTLVSDASQLDLPQYTTTGPQAGVRTSWDRVMVDSISVIIGAATQSVTRHLSPGGEFREKFLTDLQRRLDREAADLS